MSNLILGIPNFMKVALLDMALSSHEWFEENKFVQHNPSYQDP